MTSINSESAATIVVSCKQTRFHIDSPNYREVRRLRCVEIAIQTLILPPCLSGVVGC